VALAAGRWLRVAIWILRVQAIVVGLLTLATIWIAIVSTNVSLASAVATPAFAALFALIFAGLAAALSRGKALARGPAITLEMLLIPIGYVMVQAGLGLLGIPTAIVGLAGAAALLAPSTRTALGLDRR
jgi:hypothetical protein